MQKIKYLVLTVLILLVSQCENKIVDPGADIREPAIYGRVTKANGIAVALVDVHMVMFNEEELRRLQKTIDKSENSNDLAVNFLYQNYPNPTHAVTGIVFGLEKECDMALNIFDFKGNLTRHLASGLKSSGAYKVRWDLKNDNGEFVALGPYRCLLTIGGEQHEIIICVNNYDLEAVNEYHKPLTQTDKNGDFMIRYDQIPVGRNIVVTTEDGPTPVGSIRVDHIYLVLFKDKFKSVFRKVEMDTSKATSMKFELTAG
jgi:hypothetical protein